MGYILIALISIPAFAAEPAFSLLVKRKRDAAYYKITKEGKSWICETNHFPFYEAKENPLAKMNWKALEKESKGLPKLCENLVVMENSLEGKAKSVTTCLDQKETLSLYERISSLCRSKI